MEQNHSSLKYPRAEYFFQAIEMANEEASSELDLEADFFSWKVVKRRERPRRHTVSHAAPPAPPSTPTSLSKEHDPLSELSLSMSPTEHSAGLTTNGSDIGQGNAHGVAAEEEECRLGSLLYILDYAPKYKKKLKEQQRTDAELAELFKVITITGGGSGRGSASAAGGNSTKGEPSSKSEVEHGVSIASRQIRRAKLKASLFKIHRNPDDPIRDLHDEDSLSAPEFEAAAEENLTASRRSLRFKGGKRRCKGPGGYRQRSAGRFEWMKRMEKVVDTFDVTMSFQPTQ